MELAGSSFPPFWGEGRGGHFSLGTQAFLPGTSRDVRLLGPQFVGFRAPCKNSSKCQGSLALALQVAGAAGLWCLIIKSYKFMWVLESFYRVSRHLHWDFQILKQTQVCPDSLVPLMAARGVEMILGILGILQTGSGCALSSLPPKSFSSFLGMIIRMGR